MAAIFRIVTRMENFGIANSTLELGLYYVLINVILGKWVSGDFSCLVQGDLREYCTLYVYRNVLYHADMHLMYIFINI